MCKQAGERNTQGNRSKNGRLHSPLPPILAWMRNVTQALQQHVQVGEIPTEKHARRHGFTEEPQERDMRTRQDDPTDTDLNRQHIRVFAPKYRTIRLAHR